MRTVLASHPRWWRNSIDYQVCAREESLWNGWGTSQVERRRESETWLIGPTKGGLLWCEPPDHPLKQTLPTNSPLLSLHPCNGWRGGPTWVGRAPGSRSKRCFRACRRRPAWGSGRSPSSPAPPWARPGSRSWLGTRCPQEFSSYFSGRVLRLQYMM